MGFAFLTRNHSRLTGLAEDDHPHYLLADGTREAAYLVITDGEGHYLQVPQLTTTQRDALSAVNGMIIYNATTGQFERYEAGSWGALGAGAHGAALHTNVTRELFIPAAAAFGNGTLLSFTPLAVWELVDAQTKIIDGFNFNVPDDFVSFVKAELEWICGAASGNMNWQMRAWYGAAGAAYTEHSDGPAAGVTATGGANRVNVQEPENALTLADLAKGDRIGIRIDRYGADATDTLGVSVYVRGLLFTYVAEQ